MSRGASRREGLCFGYALPLLSFDFLANDGESSVQAQPQGALPGDGKRLVFRCFLKFLGQLVNFGEHIRVDLQTN